jgi:hypothetical protein
MEKQVYEFISKQTKDPIIERRTCKRTWQDFPIFQSEINLMEKISPVIWWVKYLLSKPNICPQIRDMQRLAIRNERKFYTFINNKWKKEITTISPDMDIKVLSLKDFYDNDNYKFWKDYTWNFLENIKDLIKSMPQLAKLTYEMENAEYCNQETNDKNCYMNTGWHINENSMHNTYSVRSKRTVDNYRVWDSEIIYQSINVAKSQNIFFSQYIENSFNTRFSYDIIGWQNILFGYWLRNSQYVYKNKVLLKEERDVIFKIYKEKIKSYKWLQEIMKEYKIFIDQFPKKSTWNTTIENVSWSEITNSKNILNSFVWEESEDISNSYIFAGLKSCADISSTWRCEKSYNIASSMECNWLISCSHIFSGKTNNTFYSYMMQWWSFNLWSCGLTNQNNTILNKKYNSNDREKLTIQIIKEIQSKGNFWEFFDISLSPYPYNDSVAYDYYPVNKIIENWKETIINENGIWTVYIENSQQKISNAIRDIWWEEKLKIKRRTKDNEINIPAWIELLNYENIPDNIDEIEDDILNNAIICKSTWRPFRIVSMELDFHRKYGIPIPREHYDFRHYKKIEKRPPRKLHLRNCDKCETEMLSVYPWDFEWKVYCEKCYNKEIYW